MPRSTAYLLVVTITLSLLGADLLLLTSDAVVSRSVKEELSKLFGEAVTFDQASVSLGGTIRFRRVAATVTDARLPLFNADEIRMHFRGGLLSGHVDRIRIFRPHLRFREQFLESLAQGKPDRPLREVVRSQDLPSIDFIGGTVEVEYPAVLRSSTPHLFHVESLAGAPIDGYVYALRGTVSHGRLGSWRVGGELNIETGAMRLNLSCPLVALQPEVRELLSDPAQKVWDRWQPEGGASVYLRIEGGGDEPLQYRATVQPRDMALTYFRFPYRVEHLEGEIEFTEEGFSAREIRSRMGMTEIRVHAKTDGFDGNEALDVHIEGENVVLEERLHRALLVVQENAWNRKGTPPDERHDLWKDYSPSGSVDVDWRVHRERGENQEDQHLGVIRARGGVNLTYSVVPLPMSEVAGEVVYRPQQIQLNHLTARESNARIGVHGVVIPGHGTRLQIDGVGVRIEPTFTAAMPEGVRKMLEMLRLEGNGNLRLDLDVKESETDYTLDLELNDARLALSVPIEKIDGSVLLAGRTASEGGSVLGHLHLARAQIAGKTVSDLLASVHQQGSVLGFGGIRASAYGGGIRGSLSVDSESGAYRGEFSGDRLDLGEFVRETETLREKAVLGKVSFELRDLSGNANDLRSMGGAGSLTIRDGYLWDIPVFVSLWNLNPQNLLKRQNQFEAGRIRYRIRDGKFLLREMAFTSPDASVVGYGNIGFDGTLDLALRTVGGSLFGVKLPGLDLLLSAFDWVRGQFVGVHVTGTFDKPEQSVQLLPGLTSPEE